MLTRKELLLQGISVKEEETEEKMALPPSLNGASSKKEKKHIGLFSPALFKESLHSNRVGLSVVSAGNALIMIIIIMILSTLNINSTSDALKDLFNNADTETTIKSGAIGLYTGFCNTGEAYDSFLSGEEQLVDVNAQALAFPDDSNMTNELSALTLVYDGAYRVSSGDDATKNATAKNTTMSAANVFVDNQSSMSDQEKMVAKQAISDYFDVYMQDKTATARNILIKSLPTTFSTVIGTEFGLTYDTIGDIFTVYQNMFDEVFNQNVDATKANRKYTYDILPLVATEDTEEFVTSLSEKLKTTYLADEDKYLADSTIESNIISTEAQSYMVSLLEESAYYQYLPDFTVEYVTSDRGYPIRYVGTGVYADNGEEIMKSIEVKSYNPEVYVEIKGEMGTTANMAQKMHKDVITGEGYTDEEIEAAKKEAKEQLGTLKTELSAFMKEYVNRGVDGTNEYFDGSSMIKSKVQERVVSLVSAEAQIELINRYNDTHDVAINSIQQITAENYSMDGTAMMNLVEGYASSGMASYETHLASALKKGYSLTDATLVATVSGSQGVVDQLPSKVNSALSEMGDMNTYGIMVGVVAFGIAALLIPMVYTILLSNNLVANKVETGSLAFTLSTPTTRGSFVYTEGLYLMFSEVVMGASILVASLLAQIIGVAMGGADLKVSLPVDQICFYSLGNFMVTFAVSGICFLSSCYFNKSNKAIAAGGGLTIFFFICSILGLFGTDAIPATVRISSMNFFNYCTIDSLFDALAVMHGDWMKYWLKLLALLIIGLTTYGLGNVFFTKKDLPL